ncbi:hypothetical protein DL769_010123 [Monosporascus sp. CRB-8-3]|nr:hypothetical protein DL769_010123 [Monosporascus sp. CRB-8-3]
MDKPTPNTQTEATDSRRINRRSFPYVLDLNLPSIDWNISAPWGQGRFSTIGDDDLSVFTPLETVQIAALDAIVPTRRISWRESVGSVGELNRRSQTGPARTVSTRTAKGQPARPFSYLASPVSGLPSEATLREETDDGDESPIYNRSSAHQSRFSWPPDSEVLESKPEYPTGFGLWIMIVALIFSIFLIALDMTIVATAIPAITDDFQGLQDVAWYGAAFFMTTGGFQSAWGKIFKYFPLKTGYLVSIGIFQAGSILCAAAPTSMIFIIGRAIAGVGAAGVSCGSYTIVAFIAEPKKRPAYTGILSAVFGIASVLGPLIGGVFSSSVTWRWCFWINLPVGVLPLVTIVFFFRTPEAAQPQDATLREKLLQLDPAGTSLLMGGIVTYLMAVHYGGQIYPWNSSLVIGLLVGSGLICVVFGLYEYWQGERAAIIPRLFRRREILLSALYSILLPGALHTMIYYIPIYFQAIRGSDAITSGVQNLPLIVSAMTGAVGAGLFISATGMSTVVMVGGAALGALGCGVFYTVGMDTPTGRWVGFQILAGFGLGGAFQIPVIVGQVSVDAVDLSSTTALLLCFQTVGAALVVSAAQAVFVNRMILAVPALAPGVDPMRVVATGAGQLRSVFTAEELPGVLAAYLVGIRATFILACSVAGTAFLLAMVLPWKRLNTVAVKETGGAA